MRITGTFLDEISHDIPHQNWGPEEWDRDFASMKHIGIDTVIMIRCGARRFIAYPSQVLTKTQNCYPPPIDLVELFLNLAEKNSMKFFFGLYDAGKYLTGSEVTLNCRVIEEVYEKYGHHRSFGGWYLPVEIGRRTTNVIELMAEMGRYCKKVSDGLPVLISPWMLGSKVVDGMPKELQYNNIATLTEHEREWDSILSDFEGAVDIVAFQDGHADFYELPDYFKVNRKLIEKHGMECWTNCECFDRDIPNMLPPIKWEKMLLKLEAARAAGFTKAITFEYSHFMSPNSCYLQAHHLYNRYCEHFGIEK